jgi:diguanylate cyclase (GGDEF)-like protein/PAS domain S-box-containing protein
MDLDGSEHDTLQGEELYTLRQRIAEFQQEHDTARQEVAALRAEREYFRLITDFTYDWEYWLAPDGTYRYVSPSSERITGYRPDEFYGDPRLLERIVHPDDREHMARHLRDVQRRQQSYTLQFRIITRGGEKRWISHACQPMYNAEGDWLGQRASNRDITERKRIEEALRESQQFIQRTTDIAPYMIYVFDLISGYNTFANPYTLTFFGCTLEELQQRGQKLIGSRLHPDDSDQMAAFQVQWNDATDDQVFYKEYRMQNAAGDWRWLHSSEVVFQRDEHGTPTHIMGAAIDITKRKQAEEALRESEERYRTLVNNFPDGVVFLFDQDMRYLVAGGSQLSVLGVTPEMLEGKTLRKAVPPDIAAIGEPLYRATLAGTAPAELEQYYGDHTYRTQPVSLRNGKGDIVAGMIISQDITARRQIEKALRESEERHRAMFEQNRAIKLLIDPATGTIIDANLAASEFYGYPLDTLRRMKITDLNVLSPEEVHAEMQRARTEQRLYFLFRHRLASGDVRDVEVYSGPIDIGGKQLLFSIIHDVTARKQVEEQLQRTNEWLKQRNHEVILLNQMGEALQRCQGVADACQVIANNAAALFTEHSGAFHIRRNETTSFDTVARWGTPLPPEPTLDQATCRVLRERQVSFFSRVEPGVCRCLHLDNAKNALCVPLLVQDDVSGILHLRTDAPMKEDNLQHWQQLAETVARQGALALSNLTLRERLQQQAIRDGLTGLFNRRYLDETLPREVQRAERQEQSVGVIMLDIDHFKRFNDTYGHDAGDVLLRAMGAFLKNNIRNEDIVCRYGGEEFTLVLPRASLDNTRARAEYLREGVKSLVVRYQGQTLDAVTVSLGVAIFPDQGSTADEVVKAADEALYRAKRSGRDRVVAGEARSTPETS